MSAFQLPEIIACSALLILDAKYFLPVLYVWLSPRLLPVFYAVFLRGVFSAATSC